MRFVYGILKIMVFYQLLKGLVFLILWLYVYLDLRSEGYLTL